MKISLSYGPRTNNATLNIFELIYRVMVLSMILRLPCSLKMSSVQYNAVPQANSPLQFSESAQAAESQAQPGGSRFNSCNVAIIAGVLVVCAVVAVVVIVVSSSDEVFDKSDGLAGRNVTAVMNATKMMTKAVTQPITEAITRAAEPVTEAITRAAEQATALLDRYRIPCRKLPGVPFCYSTNPCDLIPPCPPGSVCSSLKVIDRSEYIEYKPPLCWRP